jgi:hypothetical protein
MQGTEQPSCAPLTVFALNSVNMPEAIKDYAHCDANVSGTPAPPLPTSTYDDDPARRPTGTADKLRLLGATRFHGHMCLVVCPSYGPTTCEQHARGSYTGFRNKVRRTRVRV